MSAARENSALRPRAFERVGGKRTVRPVSFRVSEAARTDGEAVAAAEGLTLGQLARQLLMRRLRPAAPAPAAVSTPGEVSTPTDGGGEPEHEIKVVYDE